MTVFISFLQKPEYNNMSREAGVQSYVVGMTFEELTI
jgi:hypothetical protein